MPNSEELIIPSESHNLGMGRKAIDLRGKFPQAADACVVMVVQSTTTQTR